MHTLGIEKFLVYMSAALFVFVAALIFTLRKRSKRPVFKIFVLAIIVVVFGMTFARITYSKGVPWWIFYGIPALTTSILPPLVLQMSKKELFIYIPLAVIMAPTIHILFSFFFDWHDYMPLFHVPWWRELF